MSKPTLSIGFDVPFTEAIAWANARIAVLPDTYYGQLTNQARSRAFTVSGLASLDQIQGVLDSLAHATANGQTFADWKKTLSPEALALGKARLDNIFRTGIQTHYNIGRYEQQERNKAHRPYRMYDAINDGRTRPHHKALDNFIAPIDDAVWRKIYPPNGFRCRCSTITLTEAQAIQRGYKKGNIPSMDGRADEGWDYNPATGQDAMLAKIVRQRLSLCDAFDFAGNKKAVPVQCINQHANSVLRGLEKGGDNGGMKPPIDFMGQRPSLRDIQPLLVTELTGKEFGVSLSHSELVAAANDYLRTIQKGDGLSNGDTGWDFRINKKGRKKIGDNEGQSDVELMAVAGIRSLVKHAVVAERHADIDHHNPDVTAVIRLYSPLAIQGMIYRVKLTVKDYSTSGNPKMLHALAAVEIENAPLGTLPAYSGAEALQQAQPTTGRTINIADLLKNATMNDGISFFVVD